MKKPVRILDPTAVAEERKARFVTLSDERAAFYRGFRSGLGRGWDDAGLSVVACEYAHRFGHAPVN